MGEESAGTREILIGPEEFERIYAEWKGRIARALADRPFAIVGIMRRGYYLGLRLRQDFLESVTYGVSGTE